jgi:hypothetical protein
MIIQPLMMSILIGHPTHSQMVANVIPTLITKKQKDIHYINAIVEWKMGFISIGL